MAEKNAITNSSLARIAGNIASGMVAHPYFNDTVSMERIARNSVLLARLIVRNIEESPVSRVPEEGK